MDRKGMQQLSADLDRALSELRMTQESISSLPQGSPIPTSVIASSLASITRSLSIIETEKEALDNAITTAPQVLTLRHETEANVLGDEFNHPFSVGPDGDFRS